MPSDPNSADFKKEYIIGIPELDEQHETFLTMLDAITDVAPDPYKPLDEDEADDLVDVLGELRDHALLHFRTEEDCMEEVDYPGLGDQEEAHARFIADLTRMEAEVMNGTAIPAIKIRNFVHDWLRDHILELDKPFAKFQGEKEA